MVVKSSVVEVTTDSPSAQVLSLWPFHRRTAGVRSAGPEFR